MGVGAAQSQPGSASSQVEVRCVLQDPQSVALLKPKPLPSEVVTCRFVEKNLSCIIPTLL